MPQRIPTGKQIKAEEERAKRYRRIEAATGLGLFAVHELRQVARNGTDWQEAAAHDQATRNTLHQLEDKGMVELRVKYEVRLTPSGSAALDRADAAAREEG